MTSSQKVFIYILAVVAGCGLSCLGEVTEVTPAEADAVRGALSLPKCYSKCSPTDNVQCQAPLTPDPCDQFEADPGSGCAYTEFNDPGGVLVLCVAIPKFTTCEQQGLFKGCIGAPRFLDFCYPGEGPPNPNCGKIESNACERPTPADYEAKRCPKTCKIVFLTKDCQNDCK